MTDNPARVAAEREAAKREAHKPRSLSHMRWAATHDSIRGWHVTLLATPPSPSPDMDKDMIDG